MLHWCEMPAPRLARKLAAEAIRERDIVPAVVFCDTPREEDGSRDDLLYWLRAVERFLEAVKVGWISKQEWTHWRRTFESIPVVAVHFGALLPDALRTRRLRREHDRAQAAKREELELAKAVCSVPADTGGKRMFPRSEWRRKEFDNRSAPPHPVSSGVRRSARVQPQRRY